jgi:hypothetical protein
MSLLRNGARDRTRIHPGGVALAAFATVALSLVLWARYGPEVFAAMISSAVALCF